MLFLSLRAIKAHLILMFTSFALIAIGCGDDDHDHDHDEDHTDANGFILENEAGAEIYRQFEGTVTEGVVISVGDTLELSVHFLDPDGNEIEHSEEEEEEDHEDGLVVSENNDSIAIVEVEEHEEEGEDDDHEEEHGMAIHVIGVSAGSTGFKLELMHEGHADYTSAINVSITVN